MKTQELNCPFCQTTEFSYPISERMVYVTPTAYAAVTLGAFRVGYFLVIPNKHVSSLASLPPDQRRNLLCFAQKITDRIQKKQEQKCIWFEHGSSDNSITSPQSVNHCHLHIVPYTATIYDSIRSENHHKFQSIFDAYDYLVSSKAPNYILIKDTNSTCYVICPANNYPSQYIRQIMCQQLKINNYWNWRTHPHIDYIHNTLALYQNDIIE